MRRVLVESPSQSAPPNPPAKGPKAKVAPKRPVPVIAGKLCSKWCASQEITLKDLQNSINEGTEPNGKFCLATALKAAELVMLAKTHNLTAKCALILPVHCKEDLDDSLCPTHRWVQVVGKGWIKSTVVPLTSSGLPVWPSRPAQVKVGDDSIVNAPEQVTVRITIPKFWLNFFLLGPMPVPMLGRSKRTNTTVSLWDISRFPKITSSHSSMLVVLGVCSLIRSLPRCKKSHPCLGSSPQKRI